MPDPKFKIGDRVYIARHIAVGTITDVNIDYEYYKVRFYEDNTGYREGIFSESELIFQPELPFHGDEPTPDNSAFTVWLEKRKKS